MILIILLFRLLFLDLSQSLNVGTLYFFSTYLYPFLGYKWPLVGGWFSHLFRCLWSFRALDHIIYWIAPPGCPIRILNLIGFEEKLIIFFHTPTLFLLYFLSWSTALLFAQLYEPNKLKCPSLLPLPNWSCHQVWLIIFP